MAGHALRELTELVDGLELAGCPLEAPRLAVGGKVLDVAVAPPPSFLATKDPKAQQQRTSVEDVPLPRHASVLHVGGRLGMSLARIVHGVLEPCECAELLAQANERGFVRLENRYRCMLDCPELAAYVFEVLRPHLPEQLCRGQEHLAELNDRFRCTFYAPGQEFKPHCDPCCSYPSGHPRHGQTSRLTVLLHLNGVAEADGGATHLAGATRASRQPRCGSDMKVPWSPGGSSTSYAPRLCTRKIKRPRSWKRSSTASDGRVATVQIHAALLPSRHRPGAAVFPPAAAAAAAAASAGSRLRAGWPAPVQTPR